MPLMHGEARNLLGNNGIIFYDWLLRKIIKDKMMINKRLIETVSESKKYTAGNVACQWISLMANIVMMGNITIKMSYLSSKAVKKTLREMIYKKLLRLGTPYNERVKTSEVVQVAVEGADQLETYMCTTYSSGYCCRTEMGKKAFG